MTKRAALFFYLALAGCAFKIAPGDDWLPLTGQPQSTDGLPQTATNGQPYLATDGRLWSESPGDFTGAFNLFSYEIPSQTVSMPPGSQLVGEGVVTVMPLDPLPSQRFTVTLSIPGQPPRVTAEFTLTRANPFLPGIERGTGYFAALDIALGEEPSPSPTSILLAFDDGRTDSIPTSDSGWIPTDLIDPETPGPPIRLGGDARYLLLRGSLGTAAVYDLQERHLSTLFQIPEPFELHKNGVNYSYFPISIYDQPRTRYWVAGSTTVFADVSTGQVTELPFSTVDLHINSDGTGLIQDSDGNLYTLDAGGAPTLVGNFEPGAIKAHLGTRFVYTKPGFDNFDQQAFGGWLGDRKIIQSGLSATFSADGKKLRWLEDAANDARAGDLYSMDLATFDVTHLVRNVTGFSELPDGRLVAIADAAVAGAWNRAVLIDEEKAKVSWLVRGVQQLQVIKDRVLVTRVQGDVNPTFLISIPPR